MSKNQPTAAPTVPEADDASRKWVESRRPDPDACDEDALDRATQECR